MSIKKKYESLLGKRSEMSKTKYVKTEEDCTQSGIVNRKKVDPSSFNKFFYEKKKKSVSGIENKRQSDIIARYMYKNRYI